MSLTDPSPDKPPTDGSVSPLSSCSGSIDATSGDTTEPRSKVNVPYKPDRILPAVPRPVWRHREEAGDRHYEPHPNYELYPRRSDDNNRYVDPISLEPSFPLDPCTNDPQELSRDVVLSGMQDFRRLSLLEWKNVVPSFFTTSPPTTGVFGAHQENMKAIPSLPSSGPFAIYIVWDLWNDHLTLIPHHRKLVASNRQDLFMVTLTSHSKDLLNPGPVQMKNYLKGDAICVRTLNRRRYAWDHDFLVSTDEILNPESHKFWAVGEFYLIQRKLKENCLVTSVGREGFIADGFNTLCDAPDDFSDLPGQVYHAKIFVPYLQPESFLPGTDEKEQKIQISETKHYCPGYHVYPSIVALSGIGAELEQELQYAKNPFQLMDRVPPRIFFTSGHFGLSGKLAMENSDKDLGFYPTKITNVTKKRGAKVVEFTLKNGYGAPRDSQWVKLTKFLMNFKGTVFEMEVESCTNKNNKLYLTGRSVSKNRKDLDVIKEIRGKIVVIYQEIQNNLHHLKNFPTLEEFEEFQWDTNFGKCLKALLGGERILGASRNLDSKVSESPLRKMLTDEQGEYADAMTHGDLPGGAVDSCFRGGKTFAVAVTANLLAMESRIKSADDHLIHLACSNTNIAVKALTETHLTLPYPARAVRLINFNRFRQADKNNHTPIDYPLLWPNVLRRHVMAMDAKVYSEEEEDEYDIDDVTQSAFHYLKKKDLKRGDFKSSTFLDRLEQKGEPQMSRLDTFVAIYKPQIIFATHSAVTASLHTGKFEKFKAKIATIQFDEAHRLPMFSLISLGLRIPDACFGFIGDSRSLPAFSEPLLPSDLWNYTIRKVLEDSWKKLPSFKFTKCFDTQMDLVKNCNDHFYGNTLCSMGRVDLKGLRDFVGNIFPIQILNNPELLEREQHSGNSLYCSQEAHLAVQLVKKIQKQFPQLEIGILTFYRAQCSQVSRIHGIENVFIGTVDCSQDYNFDVTIILTTRPDSFHESKFLEDPKRLNVAFSRAKDACFVIVNEEAARSSEIWKGILEGVPKEARRDARTFIGIGEGGEEEEDDGVRQRKRRYTGPRPEFR
ncbi:hypothetical protein GCK72_008293 [Caenorhabditis remanei]|uniref:DNA2/NAM7 helicase-like C-terminal domain-containing protein n=1 Tax=Caenorhabditis remanei TaxID=31234 RepID=A0A6A5GY77_CAERE|nr:hypothetical protein GCK72_008293 [Caenorhabditis remanei]KAF1760047.1 hypothetical protein GCK72_008293 [Caenorhabditis remanei]